MCYRTSMGTKYQLVKKNGTKSGAAMAALVPTALSALRG